MIITIIKLLLAMLTGSIIGIISSYLYVRRDKGIKYIIKSFKKNTMFSLLQIIYQILIGYIIGILIVTGIVGIIIVFNTSSIPLVALTIALMISVCPYLTHTIKTDKRLHRILDKIYKIY